jgi:hypothetical protein
MSGSALLYALVGATVGMGVVLALLFGRLACLEGSVGRLTARVPKGENLDRYIERVVAREQPAALRALFEDSAARLREDLRRFVRREIHEQTFRPEFHERLERAIEDKLMGGAFERHLARLVDERSRAITTLVETELLPRALAARDRPAPRRAPQAGPA